MPWGALAPAARVRHLRATMSLTLTLILLAASVPLTAFAGWRGAQPPDIARGPRMVPWRFVMLMGAALSVMLLIHLARVAAGAD